MNLLKSSQKRASALSGLAALGKPFPKRNVLSFPWKLASPKTQFRYTLFGEEGVFGKPISGSTLSGWQPISSRKIIDTRALSDSQAAPIALKGQHIHNGKATPIPSVDGGTPAYAGTNAQAFKSELDRLSNSSDNSVLKKIYNDLITPGEHNAHGEISIPHSKLPVQGYTALDGYWDPVKEVPTQYFPWRATVAPSGHQLNSQRTGAGAPASAVSRQISDLISPLDFFTSERPAE